MQRFEFGAVTVTPLVQFTYLVAPAKFFAQLEGDEQPVAPEWFRRPPYVDAESGRLRIDMGGFLIRTPDHTMLIDLGIGDDKSRPNPVFDRRHDDWPAQLARAGVAPEQVDTVLFTHLHVDHVGNATRLEGSRWVPVFTRARHLTTAVELDFWRSPVAAPEFARLGDYVSDSVSPLVEAGLLDTVAADQVLTPEVRLVPAAGHTPGNVCVEVRSEGVRAVFCGDMVHHPIQLAHPDWSTNFCIDQHQAAEARQALLAELADTDDWLIPAHFPESAPCRIRTDGDAYRIAR